MARRSLVLFACAALLAGCGSEIAGPVDAAAQRSVEERVATHGFPRLALQLQLCCQSPSTLEALRQAALWDLVVVDAEAVRRLPSHLGAGGSIRAMNPGAVIVTYFSAGDVNPHTNTSIPSAFLADVHADWMLRDVNGQAIPLYEVEPGRWTYALDMGSGVNQFLPDFLAQHVLSTGLVDGIFYDWASSGVSWLNRRSPALTGPIDLDGDGVAESDEEVDSHWVGGYRQMLDNSRDRYGAEAVLLGNAGWNANPVYDDLLNGIMIEQFLQGEDSDRVRFGWGGVMATYGHYLDVAPEPRLSLIMANSDDAFDLELQRFGLASALMFDGYFAFTNDTGAYLTTRWADEYSVDLATGRAVRSLDTKGYLGEPLTAAYRANDPSVELLASLQSNAFLTMGIVWRRDFENGVVLVNPSYVAQDAEVGPGLRKIAGILDPAFNDGAPVSFLTLEPRSGVILLRDD